MKKLVFALVAMVAMSFSGHAQAIKGYIALNFNGFGKVSSYAGPCVAATGFCSGSISIDPSDPSNPDMPFIGVIRNAENKVSFGFNEAFRRQNAQFLTNNTIVIGKAFSLPREVSTKLGLGEYEIQPGNYKVTVSEGYYYCTF